MTVTVVRYRTKPDRGDENQALVEQVYAELDQARPDGFRYATFRLDDGVTFVHVAELDRPDGTNPLGATKAFAEFQRDIADRCDEPPVALQGAVVGSYRFPIGPGSGVEP